MNIYKRKDSLRTLFPRIKGGKETRNSASSWCEECGSATAAFSRAILCCSLPLTFSEEPWMGGLWSDLCCIFLTSLPHSDSQLWPLRHIPALQGLRSSCLSKAQGFGASCWMFASGCSTVTTWDIPNSCCLTCTPHAALHVKQQCLPLFIIC